MKFKKMTLFSIFFFMALTSLIASPAWATIDGVTKTFSNPTITAGETSTLTIVISNRSGHSGTYSFRDSYPNGLTNANPSSPSSDCGTATAVAGDDKLDFSGDSIKGNKTCTVTVLVTASTVDNYTNSVTVVTGISDSATLTVTAGAANNLAFVKQPSNTVVGAAISPAITVIIQDLYGNTVITDNSTSVTLTIGTNPGGGTLNGTVPVTAVAGVATFGDLSINMVGVGYTLAASSSPILTYPVSEPFTVYIPNPVPTTISISPTSMNVGAAEFTLTVEGTNFVSTSVARFAGENRTTTYDSVTKLYVTIPATDLTSAGTFNITVFNPAPGGGTSNAQLFTVFMPNFDAVEFGAAKATPLYTKLAGTDFSLDILALDSSGNLSLVYDGTVSLKLVDATSAGTCANMDPLQDYGNYPFAAGTGRLTVNPLSYAKAASNARIRIYDAAAGVTTCSSDNFAIRPGAVTLDTTALAAPPSATVLPKIKAGADFTITAGTSTAVTDAYTGTLTLDTSKLTAQAGGVTVGTLTPASLIANAAPSDNASYTEVGYLYLAPGAFRDDDYTSVDQPNDCISSTTGDANLADNLSGGKYGCSIGNITPVSFGRFYPDHFIATVANNGSFANLTTNPFTYLGESFGYTPGDEPQFTIYPKALGADDTDSTDRTYNYTGDFNKIDLDEITLSYPTSDISQFDQNGIPGDTLINLTSNPGPHDLTDNNNGTTTLTLVDPLGASADSFSYDRSLGLVIPFYPNLTISLASVIETEDGTSTTNDPLNDPLPVTLDGTGAEQRFGRAVLLNTFGPETQDQAMPLILEFYDIDDSYPLLPTPTYNFFSNDLDLTTTFIGLLPAGPSDLNCFDPAVPPADTLECGDVVVSDGDVRHNETFPLTKPDLNNTGVLDYTLTVPSWLMYDWNGIDEGPDSNFYDDNPSATATFGIYRGNDRIINWREIIR
jgi:hypothetical protein